MNMNKLELSNQLPEIAQLESVKDIDIQWTAHIQKYLFPYVILNKIRFFVLILDSIQLRLAHTSSK